MRHSGKPEAQNRALGAEIKRGEYVPRFPRARLVAPAHSQQSMRARLERPVLPVHSYQSMRSDHLLNPLNEFKGEGSSFDTRFKPWRTVTPVPSCLSMKSDDSMNRKNEFRRQDFHFDKSYIGPRDVTCDVCPVRTIRAVKSCLTCAASYCETHVRQHYTAPALQTHRLEDTTGDLEHRLCQQHRRALEFCETDQTWICSLCALENHKSHDIVFAKTRQDVKQALWTTTSELTDHPKDFHTGGFHDMNRRGMSLKRVQEKHKSILKERFECIFEGIGKPGKQTLLNNIYTEVYITEGESEGVNNEHEVMQIEMAHQKKETVIKCNDIFKPLSGQEKTIRTVLTKGIAGIGKTVSVQKFILDWATGKANEDIHFTFFLPFRGLNLMKGEKYSLLNLLYYYHPELREIGNIQLSDFKVLLIFDGLDESRTQLDFQNNQMCHDVTQSTSVNVLLTNLIRGNLLPSALLWITSRPAAASQIPAECIHQVTEVRGFNDEQKEEYFRRRVRDRNLASAIIKHIKSSRSLHIMCHIPIFCWISATVLERILGKASSGVIPTTLSGMYTHFLLILTNIKNQKYLCGIETSTQNLLDSEKENILKLGKLAFKHLENGNLIFYKNDLTKCDIDVSQASVYSGVFTEIFKEESEIIQEKVYCFVHLSIQEYFAALYVFLSYTNCNRNLLNQTIASKLKTQFKSVHLSEVHKTAVDKALQSTNGHLDLFLRFLLGISMDSNQNLLRGLMTQTNSSFQSIQETANYIKILIRKESSTERCINLFHCLNELNDNSLVEEIKGFMSLGNRSERMLSTEQWSALVYVLLTSEGSFDVFDLKKYSRSEEGCLKLLPVIKNSRRALLDQCNLSVKSCEALASALCSNSSTLRDLDLRDNEIEDSGMKKLSTGLMHPNCKLQRLSLAGCEITSEGFAALASALYSNSSTLRELDLSYNHPGDIGMRLLCNGLVDANCKLEKLLLLECGIKENGCEELALVLRSNFSTLRELDLSCNLLGDSVVTLLYSAVQNPSCKLEKLVLSDCGVTERGFAVLATTLRSNTSHLRELDLSYNHLGDSSEILLSDGLEDPNCKLEKLVIDHSGEHRKKPRPLRYACQLTLNPNTAYNHLSLSEGNRKATQRRKEQPYPDHPERFDYRPQVLCSEGLTGRCYWEAEWSRREAGIGVAYKGMGRKGAGLDCFLGLNDMSWSLYCEGDTCFARHRKKKTAIPVPPSHRIGVYLDWTAGTLSFYNVYSDTMTLLHTFHTTFTEALYPGFWVGLNSSVSLCQLT
ncbi:NACHT, LRR and PYD domains-containing protein 3 [Amia ocellicauda]|uniref:NACHT, LRR and PYD domains-containing protein 3 n=1 Tax=Amia ocellicauda TaxID=2972642 RepID=UPI0034642D5C